VSQGFKALRLEVQNQFEPYMTEATRTFAAPQDWTAAGTDMLSIMFHGYYRDADQQNDKYQCNVEKPLYAKVTDAAGQEATVTLPPYAVQSGSWRSWDIPLADLTAAGVDLTQVKALTIGVGDGTASAQTGPDVDLVFIDNIRLGFLPKAQ
jgi:hypothetical protein